MNTPSNHVNDIPMLLNLFLNLLLSNISNYLNIFLLFNRIYRPFWWVMIMIALIFWQNLGFFWQAKSEKFPKKIKFSPNMIMTNQKGPVNSIKMQKYTQKVGNI